MKRCPSALALDNWDLHAVDTSVGSHVLECPACQQRMADRRQHMEEFRSKWLATLGQGLQAAAVSAARPARKINRRVLWLAPLAVAAAMALVARPFGSKSINPPPRYELPEPYVGSKGGPFIEVVVKRGENTFSLEPGGFVRAGDQLRFVPKGVPPDYSYFQIGALNEEVYEPIYPAAAHEGSLSLPGADSPLPGAIALDEAPGPERIFVLLTKDPVTASWAATASRRVADGPLRAMRIKDTPAIVGWIVLNKR